MTQICYFVPIDDEPAPDAPNPLTVDGAGFMRGGEIRFHSDSKRGATSDWLFVMDKMYANIYSSIPRERRVLFFGEAELLRKRPTSYIEQFGILVSHYKPNGYSGIWIENHTCLAWSVGSGADGHAKRYEAGERTSITPLFKQLADVEKFTVASKQKSISIVCSLAKISKGHRDRVAFLKALRAEFGDEIDYYGREFNPVDDKIDAIAPYKYHIAIENCRENGYWTEKLTDAWVGWSLPIYCGDPTILQQIPDPDGIEIIDIQEMPTAIEKIRQILREDPYEERREAIRKCREWAIREANPCEKACVIIESAADSVRSIPLLKKPEKIKTFLPGGIKSKIYHFVTGILGKDRTKKLYRAFKKVQSLARGH